MLVPTDMGTNMVCSVGVFHVCYRIASPHGWSPKSGKVVVVVVGGLCIFGSPQASTEFVSKTVIAETLARQNTPSTNMAAVK